MVTTPVTVPAGFVGLTTKILLTPPATCGLVRAWDFLGSQNSTTKKAMPCHINTAAGVYDWVSFDELFTANTTKQIMMVLGCPADYLVSTAAVGGAYNGGKSNMCPTDLTAWATAVTAMVNRAKNTHGRTGLLWELWNEIDQTAAYAGTVADLGPYTRVTAQAIKAVDPTAVILGPSIASNDAPKVATMVSYLNASDGAGGTAKQWLDGTSTHLYNQLAAQWSQNENAIVYAQQYSNFQGALADIGVRLPIYITETGCLAADPQAFRATQRRLLTFAALGARCCVHYRWDDTSSYLMTGYASQWEAAATLLRPGAVITSFVPGMAVMRITIDGVEYSF
jgi:hypothetical protein